MAESQPLAYYIPVAKPDVAEDEGKENTVLPERLKTRFEAYQETRETPSERKLQEKLDAAERRRQRIFQRKAESARATEERCARLAEAVRVMVAQDTAKKAIQRGESVEKPYSNAEVQNILQKVETDIKQVLGKLEKEAGKMEPFPRTLETKKRPIAFEIQAPELRSKGEGAIPPRLRQRIANAHRTVPVTPSCSKKRPIAYEIPTAELKAKEDGTIPRRLRERLNSTESESKMSRKSLQEKLENAERRRMRIQLRKVEVAREAAREILLSKKDRAE